MNKFNLTKRLHVFLMFFALSYLIAFANTGGGGDNSQNYYSKVTATAPVGQGKVYVSYKNEVSNPDYNVESSAQSGADSQNSAPTHTYYLYAQPADGYYFTGWTGDGVSNENPYEVSVNAESISDENPTTKNYTANFLNLKTESPVDLTAKITNPGYEASTWSEGWTVDSFEEHENAGQFVGSHIAQMWSDGNAVNANPTSGSITQTLTNLPLGVYKLKAKAVSGTEGTSDIFAQTTAEKRTVNVPWTEGDVANYYEVMFRITPTDNNQVTIGFERNGCHWWTAVDDWSLEYLGETPAFTYDMGVRLDGTGLSKPAYTSTPSDGVDPLHADDGLLVVTWPYENTNDPWAQFKIADGAKATITADGLNTQVDLLKSFRSSTYENGFGLYIPNLDESKTYTVTIPAGSIGFATANGNAFSNDYTNVMNEEFSINAKQSPLKDGKYFITVKSTGEHVSRGGHFGTQAILDYYGVPVLVQTTGLTEFKFLDNQAYLGRSYENDELLYTDCQRDRTQLYQLIADDAHPDEYQFYTAAPKTAGKNYLAHGEESGRNVMMEQADGDYFQFEPLTVEGYAAHLATIEEDEAIRVAARAGFVVESKSEYDELIEKWETDGFETIFPTNDDEIATSQAYHEKKEGDMAAAANYEGTPRNLVTDENGEDTHVQMTLDKGLYTMHCDAFQQAMALSILQANQGFRGLVYMYVKVGDVMYKTQLKSITETTGDIPTDKESAIAALDSEDEIYGNNVIFYVPADGTTVQFGVENPQRLGNGIDEGSGSWVAFKNIKVEKFNAELAEANMKIAAGKYGTFIAPFAVKLPAGVTAYSGELNGEKTSVALTSAATEGTELAACTPVIVKNDGDADVDMTYREVDVRTDKTTVTEQKGVLVGFYKGYAEDNAALIQGDGKSWVLQTQNDKQAFYMVEPDKTFKGSKNRCYLVAPADAGVKVLNFEFADEETAIESLANGATIVEYYSVNGSKLSAPQKGINLVKMSDSTVKKIFVK